jgi:hypothetical protein
MTSRDMEFAKRSVKYLRTQGLGAEEIRLALVEELEMPPETASELAAAA